MGSGKSGEISLAEKLHNPLNVQVLLAPVWICTEKVLYQDTQSWLLSACVNDYTQNECCLVQTQQ